MKPRYAFLLLLLASFWGGSFLFMRIAAPTLGALPLSELRSLIGTALLGGWLLVRRAPLGLRGRWRPMTVVALANTGVPFALLAYATAHLPAGYAAIVNATSPLWGALVAATWLRHRLGAAAIAGLLVGFAGVALLVSERLTGASWSLSIGLAILSSLAAALCYGFAVHYSRERLTGVPALSAAFGSLLISAIVLAVPAALTWPAVALPASVWACVAALGLVCTGLAYVIYYLLIERIGPARAITVTYLVPVFGVSFGAIFLGEAITATMLAGGAVVLLGVALATGVISPSLWRGAADKPAP